MKNKKFRFYSKLFTPILALIFNGLLTGCSIEPKLSAPKEYQLGQTSYHRVCAQCHGADAMGGKRAPKLLQDKFSPKNFSNARIARTIINIFII